MIRNVLGQNAARMDKKFTQKKNQALWMKGHDLAVKMGGPRSGEAL